MKLEGIERGAEGTKIHVSFSSSDKKWFAKQAQNIGIPLEELISNAIILDTEGTGFLERWKGLRRK